MRSQQFNAAKGSMTYILGICAGALAASGWILPAITVGILGLGFLVSIEG